MAAALANPSEATFAFATSEGAQSHANTQAAEVEQVLAWEDTAEGLRGTCDAFECHMWPTEVGN
jgi:hypothetical protein